LYDANTGGCMNKFRLHAILPIAFLGLLMLTGCHSSGPTVSIVVSPSQAVSVDALQPFVFSANVGGDLSNQGVSWTLDKNTGCTFTYAKNDPGTNLGDCGALSDITTSSVKYTAPQITTTATLTVTLTVTANSNSSITQSITITVVLPPTFTIPSQPNNQPTVLPNGSNGIPYSQTIAATGGVAPLSFRISQGTLPTGLQLNANTGVIVGTPSGPSVAQPNPVIFTITLADNGTPPVTAQQIYQISINAPPVLSILATSPLASGFVNATYNNSVSTKGGVTPLTWTLVANTGGLPAGAIAGLPPGVALNPNNGQVTGVPTLDGAATYPQQYVFTAQVTDSALPTSQLQTKQFAITIQKPGVLQITPGTLSPGIAATPYTPVTIGATGGIQPYIWTLIGGQLPPGMSLGTNGVLSGVPVLATPSPNQFTVQVQDSEVVPQSATQTLDLTINPGSGNGNSLFSGQYTFLFRGFDNNGLVAIIGTITADGNGKITTGQEDINRASSIGPQVVNNATITGTYAFGTDGRGTLEFTVTNPQNGVPLVVDYRTVIDSNGNVRFFEDNSTATTTDTLNTHGQGILKPVPGSNSGSFGGFTANNFSGNYAFVFTGLDSTGKPEALGGIVNAGGAAQNFTNSTSDYNDAGTYSSQSISGDFTFSGSSGQADFAFIPAGKTQLTLPFTFYFVSPSDLFFVESYPNLSNTTGMPQLSGEMILQSTSASFGQASLNGTSIVTGQGLNGSNASVLAGLLTSTACDGSTHVSLSYDENNGGAITSPAPSFAAGTCAVSSNGRVTFSGFGSSAAQTRVAVGYLTGPGQGLIFGSDAAVTTGTMEQQTSALPIVSASVIDGYTLGASVPMEKLVNNIVGQVFAPSPGGATLVGTIDENSPPATTTSEDKTTVHANQSLVATINTLLPNGRGTLTANPLIGFPVNLVFYVVSPGSIRLMSLDAGSAHPVILTLDH
jgi:Putative Ig domain